MDLSTSISLTLIAIIVASWLIWRKRRMTLFQRLGIPGPKPNFWSGNLTEIRQKGPEYENEWIQKYGNMLGYYFGAQPILMVADPELLKTILVKDFNNFMNKDLFVPLGGIPLTEGQHIIGILKDCQWKRTRKIVTPSFSIGKLKKMIPTINESIDIFVEKIAEKADKSEPFDIYSLYRKLILDIITKTSFGVSINVQNEEDSFFLKCVMKVLNVGASEILNLVSLCFPETEPIPTWLKILKDKARAMLGLPSVKYLLDVCEDVIEKRRLSPQIRRTDLLQNLIDANVSKEEPSSETLNDPTRNPRKDKPTSKYDTISKENMHSLTNDEIKANAMLFIIAGYDTTSVTLGITTHFLVNYQDVQNKVRNEIAAKCPEITYHTLSTLSYLDQMLSETLRIYPPITSFTTRVSSKQFEFKGMTVPKGMTLQVPVWHLHRNSDYWPEPELFKPERFSGQTKFNLNSVIHQPFGMGPRNCVGNQMALLLIKLTLARVLSNYRFVPCENTKKELEISPKLFINYPKDGVTVLAVPLSSKTE